MLCNAVLLLVTLLSFRIALPVTYLTLGAYALFVLRQEWFTTR